MKGVFKYLSMATLIVASGCATGPKLTEAELKEANEPLICANKQQCDLYWQRAQVWVAEKSFYKIQLANDVIIQTYSPPADSMYMGYTIIKSPMSNGSAEIKFNPVCNSVFGCVGGIESTTLAFKKTIKYEG